MSPDEDDKREVSDRISNVVQFPRSKPFPTPPQSGMTKAEKALYIRHRILNDDLPDDLLDEMVRRLYERERNL